MDRPLVDDLLALMSESERDIWRDLFHEEPPVYRKGKQQELFTEEELKKLRVRWAKPKRSRIDGLIKSSAVTF